MILNRKNSRAICPAEIIFCRCGLFVVASAAAFVIVVMMVVVAAFTFVVVMMVVTAFTFVIMFMMMVVITFALMIMVVMLMLVVVAAAAASFTVLVFMMVVMVVSVIMVAAAVTVWFVSCVQIACQQSSYCSICITGNTCIYFDISIIQSNSCTHAHAAADQCGNTGFCQVACQCAVTEAVVSDYFAGNNCTVFYGINLKLFGTTEVLENLTVFVSYCNFHTVIPPHSDSGGSCSPVLCLHTKYNYRRRYEVRGFHTMPVPVFCGHSRKWTAPLFWPYPC